MHDHFTIWMRGVNFCTMKQWSMHAMRSHWIYIYFLLLLVYWIMLNVTKPKCDEQQPPSLPLSRLPSLSVRDEQ